MNYEEIMNLISGLRRQFKAANKGKSDEEIDELSILAETKIKEASNDIINASFDINPKQIKNDLVGCKFCEFKNICYMKNKDIIKLKEEGGEGNE